jgi:hypothetical protein
VVFQGREEKQYITPQLSLEQAAAELLNQAAKWISTIPRPIILDRQQQCASGGAASPPHRRRYHFHQIGVVKGRDRQARTRCDQLGMAEAAPNSDRGSGCRRDAGAGILERHRVLDGEELVDVTAG